MGKVLEGPGMEIFNKWGIYTPHHVVVHDPEQIDSLVESNVWMRESKMVVKAHEALGSRMKLGLVKIDLDIDGVKAAVKEIIAPRHRWPHNLTGDHLRDDSARRRVLSCRYFHS